MSGSLPWASTPSGPSTNDPADVLVRIERNTASLLTWMNILVIAVIALVVLTAVY